jgi:hypothetical protein
MEIYQFLVGNHKYGGGYNHSPTTIARYLDVSISYVCRITRQLLREGYITIDAEYHKPQLYTATKKSPQKWFKTIEKTATSLSPGEIHDFTGVPRGRVFTTSKSRWSCRISQMPSDLKTWTKRDMQNGVVQYFKEWLFGEPVNAPLKFQIVGKNNFTITVTFPPMSFDNEDDFNNAEEIISDYAKMAFRYISQKHFISLNLSDTYLSSGDFEHPLREADVKRFIETAQVIIKYRNGLKDIGNLKFDGSGKVDRIESDTPEWIVDYAVLPTFRKRLEDLEKVLDDIPAMIQNSLEVLNQNIEQTVNDKLNQLLESSKPPDTKEEVDWS